MARAQPQRGTEAWAWRLLGEIAAETDPPGVQEAETAYQEALTRASDLGMRPLVAHCHLGLGKLYRRTGDRAKAQEHLTTAATMYREMGMTLLAGEGGRGAGWSRAMTRVERRWFIAGILAPPRRAARRRGAAGGERAADRVSLARAGRHVPDMDSAAGCGDIGYVEGQSVHVEYRQAGGDAEIVAQLAVELVPSSPT